MAWTLNTTPSPTQGFSADYNNKNLVIPANDGNSYLSTTCILQRLPSGFYLLSCSNATLMNFTGTGPWWNIIESLHTVNSQITNTTFTAPYSVGFTITGLGSMYVPLILNYESSTQAIQVYSTTIATGDIISFNMLLEPQ